MEGDITSHITSMFTFDFSVVILMADVINYVNLS